MDVRGALRRAGARRVALAIAALTLSVWVLGFATRGLFSGDSGVKLAQAHGLWHTGYQSRALPHDTEVDPKGKYFPYGEFKRKVDHRWQGVYSLTYTAITAPLVGVLGMTGSLVFALAGGILILVGVDRVLGHMGARDPARAAAAIVTVGLTPLLFYSAQLAEHTPSVGLTMLALSFVIQPNPRPLLAGALVGFAATMRPECYLAVATVGIALSIRPDADLKTRVREGALYIAGALAILLPYWGLNLLLSHTWDPMVTFQKAAPDRLANVRRMLVGDLKGSAGPWPAALALAGVAALVPRKPWILRLVAGAALVWMAWSLHAHATGRTLMGTFSLTPLAAYGLAATAWNPRWRAVWVYAVLTAAAIIVLNKSNDAGGLQLGARLVLPALPALIALAAAATDDDAKAKRPANLVAPAILAIFSVVMLVRGFPAAYRIASQTEAAAELAEDAPGDVVITVVWWHSQVLTPALFEGKALYLINRKQLPDLLDRLAAHGHDEVLFIDHGDVTLTLPSGKRARTKQTWTTPFGRSRFELHDVVITDG